MNYKYIIVNTTCSNKEEALKITDLLLHNKLASCIQMSNIESHYTWKGKVEIDQEILLTIKTKAFLYNKVEKLIRDNHSYEVPQIIAIPIIKGSKEYLNWIDEVTGNNEEVII